MLASEYVQHVQRIMADRANPAIAEGQMAYMKHHFAFMGLKMPVWHAVAKEVFAQIPLPQGEQLIEVCQRCYDNEYREMHYFALELVQKSIKNQPEEFIHTLETLITTNSWWDSVDWIAKLVGIHFKQYPHLIVPTTERWMDSGILWLQRVAIIFQLHYKSSTDEELMFRYIKRVATSKEFFLQKAAGWALRQHSKINPEAVQLFVATHQLAPLTKREALRLMRNDA